jgi:hypothetical protein
MHGGLVHECPEFFVWYITINSIDKSTTRLFLESVDSLANTERTHEKKRNKEQAELPILLQVSKA